MRTRVNKSTWRDGEVYTTYKSISKEMGIALCNFKKVLKNREGQAFCISVQKKAERYWLIAEYKSDYYNLSAYNDARFLLTTIHQWYKEGRLKY